MAIAKILKGRLPLTALAVVAMDSLAKIPILGTAAASITIAVLRKIIAEQDVNPGLVLASPQAHRSCTQQSLRAPTITPTHRNTFGSDPRYQPQPFPLLGPIGTTTAALWSSLLLMGQQRQLCLRTTRFLSP